MGAARSGGLVTVDPKAMALQRFRDPARMQTGLDVIEAYATDPPIVVQSLLDAVRPAARAGARVCELGFGSGWLLDNMREAFPDTGLYGLDLSREVTLAMHARAGSKVALVRGDMERLPFLDATFDCIVTCWTLYFMRDIDATLAEIRRCLRRGGRLVAATVAHANMHEFEGAIAAAMEEAGLPEGAPDIGERFELENGEAYMRRAFERVDLVEWKGEMLLPALEPALVLMRSRTPDLSEEQLARLEVPFGRMVEAHIAREGVFRVTRHSGAWVAVA
jgi:SAM-dependent methyltransferase